MKIYDCKSESVDLLKEKKILLCFDFNRQGIRKLISLLIVSDVTSTSDVFIVFCAILVVT